MLILTLFFYVCGYLNLVITFLDQNEKIDLIYLLYFLFWPIITFIVFVRILRSKSKSNEKIHV
jgi:hypothetical protein